MWGNALADEAITAQMMDRGEQLHVGQGLLTPVADCGAGDHGSHGQHPYPCPSPCTLPGRRHHSPPRLVCVVSVHYLVEGMHQYWQTAMQ